MSVDIEDINLESIKTFEKMMDGNVEISNQEFTMDLKMFPHKYLKEPLEKECNNHIMNHF